MTQIEKIISVAKSYLGVKESPANSNNVQFNTKYYGHAVSGANYAWCAVFVWCCFDEAGLASVYTEGKKYLKDGADAYYFEGCPAVMRYAKSKGRWITGGYKKGDVILFDWDGGGTPDHVGIAASDLANGSIQVIEGNTSAGNNSDGGEVMLRAREPKDVVGAYRPAYQNIQEGLTMEQYNELKAEIAALKAKIPAEPTRYNYIDENTAKIAPDANEILTALAQKGVLKGGSEGLNLSEDMIRLLIVNARAGVYG
jgi:hypothetical protein